MQEEDELKRILDELKADNRLLSRYKCHRRINKEKAWRQFCNRTGMSFRHRFLHRRKLLQYAAILLLPISMAAWAFLAQLADTASRRMQQTLCGVETTGATLTLSDGSTLALGKSGHTSGPAGLSIDSTQVVYHSSSSQPLTAMNSLATGSKHEYTLVLEDGTRVHLAPDSRLTYPVRFDNDNRTVNLEGEAYFDIAKDSQRPFYVKTASMQVRQYGTSFNLRAYHGQPAEVVLVEGSVEVSSAGGSSRMQPGQLATVNPETCEITTKDVNTDLYTAWHTGQMRFEDSPLHELTDVLSRWYGVEIRLEDKGLGNLLFSGRLRRQENLRHILERMEYTGDITFSIEDSYILIRRAKKD